jgi:glycosyltransferase involved in cell wall biosynthesis
VRYLITHQNFPGQFLHLVKHLVGQKQNEVVFLSEPNRNHIPGVRKVAYRLSRPPSPNTFVPARELETATLRAEAVARTAARVKALGFNPDIVLGHHGWGELLNIRDIWPDVPLLGYFEWYYQVIGADVGFDPEFPTDPVDLPRIRAKNAVNLLALELGGAGQTPTRWQHSTYPDWAKRRIRVLPEGADLDLCRPDPDSRNRPLDLGGIKIVPEQKLVTYVARDLEPYRGFHIIMRALPRLLSQRRDLRVVLVGGDGVSYGAPPQKGTWREVLLAELGRKLDLRRVHFVGRVEYATYLKLLQRSDAHVYLTYPFVASWSLREALAVGCAVIGSRTPPVQEFITHGRNGLLIPFFEPTTLADTVLDVLEDKVLAQKLRAGARRYAEQHLPMARHLTAYHAAIQEIAGTLS